MGYSSDISPAKSGSGGGLQKETEKLVRWVDRRIRMFAVTIIIELLRCVVYGLNLYSGVNSFVKEYLIWHQGVQLFLGSEISV